MRVVYASLQVPGPKLANMVQNGKTPVLPASVLQEIGYTAVIYPLCLFSSALKVPRRVLPLGRLVECSWS
jgi:2-methylisocitrate lyase-like PEP mutase family enzyme